MPELGDDCPPQVTEEFMMAGLLELLRRTMLNPVRYVADVYPWDNNTFEQNEEFWRTLSQKQEEVESLLGTQDLRGDSEVRDQAIWNYTIQQLDNRNLEWWEGKTRQEEKLILSYLKSRGEGALTHIRFMNSRKKVTNLGEIKYLAGVVKKAQSLAVIKEVINLEDLLNKLIIG